MNTLLTQRWRSRVGLLRGGSLLLAFLMFLVLAKSSEPKEGSGPTSTLPMDYKEHLAGGESVATERFLSAVTLLSTETSLSTVAPLSTETSLSTVAPLSTETSLSTVAPLSTETSLSTVAPLSTETSLSTVAPLSTEGLLSTMTSLSTEGLLSTMTSLSTEGLLSTMTSLSTEYFSTVEDPLLAVEPSSFSEEFDTGKNLDVETHLIATDFFTRKSTVESHGRQVLDSRFNKKAVLTQTRVLPEKIQSSLHNRYRNRGRIAKEINFRMGDSSRTAPRGPPIRTRLIRRMVKRSFIQGMECGNIPCVTVEVVDRTTIRYAVSSDAYDWCDLRGFTIELFGLESTTEQTVYVSIGEDADAPRVEVSYSPITKHYTVNSCTIWGLMKGHTSCTKQQLIFYVNGVHKHSYGIGGYIVVTPLASLGYLTSSVRNMVVTNAFGVSWTHSAKGACSIRNCSPLFYTPVTSTKEVPICLIEPTNDISMQSTVLGYRAMCFTHPSIRFNLSTLVTESFCYQ